VNRETLPDRGEFASLQEEDLDSRLVAGNLVDHQVVDGTLSPHQRGRDLRRLLVDSLLLTRENLATAPGETCRRKGAC